MTAEIFCFYLQNRLIHTSQAGGQWYSDTSLFRIPWSLLLNQKVVGCLAFDIAVHCTVCPHPGHRTGPRMKDTSTEKLDRPTLRL